MNRIARTALIALPLSVAALTATTGTAHAYTPAPNPGPVIMAPTEPDQPGPGQIITSPDPVDPDPNPIPDEKAPLPQDDPNPNPGPDHAEELTDTPDCTHGCGEDPEFPLGNNPGDDDGEDPDFPLTSNPGDDGDGGDGEDPDFPLDQGCFEGCDLPEGEVASPETPADSIATPTRVDAGLGNDQDTGLELTWLLAGGALVTASGAAFGAHTRARKRARSHS